MSRAKIRLAFEIAFNTFNVAASNPVVPIVWENDKPDLPDAENPYQQVRFMYATPEDIEAGAAYRELGYVQVNLFYPLDGGSADAETRAQAILNAFKKATTLVNSGVTVIIDKTPAIGNGAPDVDRWMLPVKIPFHADIN